MPRIATGCTAASRERPYDDGFTDGGFLRYRYHGTDPNHRDIVGLRTAMQRQTPLIYLRGIVQGLYEPAWPVFIVEDHPEALTFIVAIDDQVGAPAAWQVNDPVHSLTHGGPEQYSDSVKDRGMATTRVRLLSLPSDLIREAERLAKQEGRTKTEVLREALRRYGQEQRWRRLQRYGAGRARKVGMRQAGVVRAVQEFRRGR